MATVGKFPNVIGKLMICKTLAIMGRKLPVLRLVITYWQFIGNHWWTGYVKHWVELVMICQTLIEQMIISHYINNISNVIKITRPIRKWLVKFGNDNNIKTALVNHW